MNVPSAQREPDRYRGRPLLLILEQYVLSTLGELTPDKEAVVRQVVQRLFGGGDDWQATLRERLQLAASMDDELRSMWANNTATAREHGVSLLPVQFAKMVVDENFASVIERIGE
jgi:hypothetical protein